MNNTFNSENETFSRLGRPSKDQLFEEEFGARLQRMSFQEIISEYQIEINLERKGDVKAIMIRAYADKKGINLSEKLLKEKFDCENFLFGPIKEVKVDFNLINEVLNDGEGEEEEIEEEESAA